MGLESKAFEGAFSCQPEMALGLFCPTLIGCLLMHSKSCR